MTQEFEEKPVSQRRRSLLQSETSQVTILPEQFRYLASLASELGGALGVSQHGSVLTVYTGQEIFRMDARGHRLDPPNQESLLD